MSQGTVSMDLMSNVAANGGATTRAVDSNVSGHHSDEFAAHLRQAGRDADRDADASGPTRGARDGGTPRRTDRTERTDRPDRADDRARTDATDDGSVPGAGSAVAPDATTNSANGQSSSSSDSDSTAVSTPTPGSGSDVAATTTTGTAAATVAATATVATAAESAAPLAAAAAGRAVMGTAGTDALPTMPRAGAKAGTAVIGSATEPSTIGSVTTGDGKEVVGGKHPGVSGAAVVNAGPSAPAQPAQPSQPDQNVTDPSVLGAATGTANPAGVVPSGSSSPAAQVRFEPGASAVTATASSTASSAPAPTTNAPQTSVAGQLAASLRTLAGRGDGVHVMTVRLHPDELGPVRVIARLTGNDVHLRVTTSTVAAAAAVSEATPRLHEALAGTGLNTTGLSVDHDADLLGGQSSGQPGGQHPTGASVDGGNGGHAGRSGAGTNGSGHSGQVTVDVPPQQPGVRHPSSRSVDLHV